MNKEPDYFLDITNEVCPLTFVKSKLLIERMKSGELALIRLKGAEPLRNVPKSIAELGHKILKLTEEDGAHSLYVEKA